MASIQGIYLALFGRPVDPLGLTYWQEQTDGGNDLSGMIGLLSASDEYTTRFAGLSETEVVTSIYQALFGRVPEAEGLAFFIEALSTGAQSIETIAINILDGARESDALVIAHKIEAANAFTASVDTQEEINAYKGDAAAAIARSFISTVTADNASVPSQAKVDAAVQEIVGPKAAGPVSGGGDAVVTDTITHDPDETVTPHNANGFLLVGSENSADHFAVTTNVTQGIELGLSVRGRYGEIYTGAADTDHVVHFNGLDPMLGRGLAFAYSVASLDADTLAANTYKLLIDVDGGSGVDYKTFILSPSTIFSINNLPEPNAPMNEPILLKQMIGSGYQWTLDADNNGVIDPGETISITDDGGNAQATQNIQPLALLSFLRDSGFSDQPTGNYSIKLQAYAGNSQLAETAIALHIDEAISTTVDGTVASPNGLSLYAGMSNPAEHFAVTTIETAGVELGLSGRYARGGVVTSTDDVADGVTHFTITQSPDFRFAYSVASTDADTLDNYVFKMKVDIDNTDDVNFMELTLVNGAWVGFTPDGTLGGRSITITDDGHDQSGKVAQNIQNIGWYDSNTASTTAAAGTYDVILEAYAKDGVTLIGSNHVVFDVALAG